MILDNENAGSLHHNYILTNKGIGPANIEYLRLTDGSGKMYDDPGLCLMDTIPLSNKIEVGYKSVYEEIWEISNRSEIPKEW